MPSASLVASWPISTEKTSSTHGRYGAVNPTSCRRDSGKGRAACGSAVAGQPCRLYAARRAGVVRRLLFRFAFARSLARSLACSLARAPAPLTPSIEICMSGLRLAQR